ncbi:hypothetical protein Mapa_001264 [Marchantia paleacea]|nr:hypothetical protein Mapa_001264 [Marchantia paleacea]
MEGGDMKAMARAKRASSKRGRARHSHHKHSHSAVDPRAAAAARDQNAAADYALPSNWQRYSDGGSGDEGAAAPVDGEVRPKSKGADYLELLSSDAPQLYEDLPAGRIVLDDAGAWTRIMGWGFLVGTTFGFRPANGARCGVPHACPVVNFVECVMALDNCSFGAALLTVDLRILGRSVAQLHVAERLMLEPELFPKQEKVKQEDHPTKVYQAGTDDRLQEEKCDDTAKTDTGAASMYGNFQDTTSSLRNNGGMDSWNQSGFAADASRIPQQSTFTEFTDTISVLKGGAPLPRRDTVEQRIRVNDRNKTETSAQPPGFRKFVPAAAEADLDDLLDMLDNQAAQTPSNTNDLSNGTEIASSPTLSFLSSKASPQFPQVDLHKGLNRIPTVGSGNHYMPSTVANTDRSEATPKEVKSSSALSLDDDFDSWLDSI